MPLLLFLGSFGVYLGRFERWNSWDIVHNPLDLAENILTHVFSPVDHIRTWAVTVTLTVLFYLIVLLYENDSTNGNKKCRPHEPAFFYNVVIFKNLIRVRDT
ncbi:MAG: DUF1361 domain-containing protein [Ferruginibacter sp.]